MVIVSHDKLQYFLIAFWYKIKCTILRAAWLYMEKITINLIILFAWLSEYFAYLATQEAPFGSIFFDTGRQHFGYEKSHTCFFLYIIICHCYYLLFFEILGNRDVVRVCQCAVLYLLPFFLMPLCGKFFYGCRHICTHKITYAHLSQVKRVRKTSIFF